MLLRLIRRMPGTRKILSVSLAFFTFLVIVPGMPLSPACSEVSCPEMQLHQVEVGCANCHLLIAGDTVILVDGGTNWYKGTGNSPDKMMEYIAGTGIDHIDAHFVTHYHNDHALQLPDFSRIYGRDSTVVYGTSEELPERFSPLPNGTYVHLQKGNELDVGPFHVLCVGPSVVRREGEINEDSLNLLVTYGSFRILFTGDYAGNDIIRDYENEVRDVDVFVFPHHGLEPFAVTSGVLLMLNPKVILIPGAMEGRQKQYCKRFHLYPEIYGNRYGNVVLFSDGKNYRILTHVQPGEVTADGLQAER